MFASLSEIIHTITTPPFVHLFIIGIILFTMGIIGRILCGIRPGKDRTRSAVVCYMVVFLYIISIIAFGEDSHLQIFAGALPFFSIASDSISIYLTMKTNFAVFMTEVAQLFLMTFTISIVQVAFDKLMHRTKNRPLKKILLSPVLFYPWYLAECIIVFTAMGINFIINNLLTNFVNETFASIVFIIFFIITLVMMILALLKFIFNTVGIFAKPFFNILNNFLVNSFIGRTIKKSFIATIAITLILLILDYFGKLAPLMSVVVPATIGTPVILLLIAIAYITWLFF